MRTKIFTTFLIFSASFSAFSLDFYISPQGDDQADGLSSEPNLTKSSGPFLSLARAQHAARQAKLENQRGQQIIIHILPGSYQLTTPLEFDSTDSGTASSPVLWQADQGNVVISGAKDVHDCILTKTNLWTCPTRGLNLESINYVQGPRKQGNAPGFELYVNKMKLTLARWPNSGWAHIREAIEPLTKFSTIETLPEFTNTKGAAQVHIFAGNDWFDQYIGVNDIVENQIHLASRTKYTLSPGRRFYIRNIASALDNPGEWFFDESNQALSFIPIGNDSPTDIKVSNLSNLLNINQASNIEFINLTFSYSTDNAININHSRDIKFRNVEINNIGGNGITSKQSKNISIANSRLHDIGASAVILNGGERSKLEPAGNRIHNCQIHDFGTVLLNYSPAISLEGVGAAASNNLIHSSTGLGVWIEGNDHLVENNELHHLCQQTSDCGAIYSGRDWTYRGNVIKDNSIHDLYGYGLKNVDLSKNIVTYSNSDGVRGVYLDDAVSGFTVSGNLFKDSGAIGVHIGGGRDNIVENNIFYTGGYAISVDNRWPKFNWNENKSRLLAVPTQSELWKKRFPALSAPMNNYMWPEGNVIRRNIVISTNSNGLALHYFLPRNGNTIEKNLVWSTVGKLNVDYSLVDQPNKTRGAAPWDAWIKQGVEQNSIYADPCIAITGNRIDFCDQTPAKQISFQPLTTNMGNTSN